MRTTTPHRAKVNSPTSSPLAIYTWPEGVAEAIGLSAPTLQRGRAKGDAPRLYAITERKLVTTGHDLLEWLRPNRPLKNRP